MNPIWLNAIRASGMITDWWRAGGAPEPVAVWQPIGAASLAASYVNLVNPGTYDAAPGVAPTWASASGWGFNGTTQYLTTGIVPSSGWAMLVRYSGVDNTNAYLIGRGAVGAGFAISPRLDILAANKVTYVSGGVVIVSPHLLSGVLGLAGQQGYRDGIADGLPALTWSGSSATPLFIGSRNDAGSPIFFVSGNIQAIAIYPSTLTAPQVAAVSAAMDALTG